MKNYVGATLVLGLMFVVADGFVRQEESLFAAFCKLLGLRK